jgi:hypothetical protein
MAVTLYPGMGLGRIDRPVIGFTLGYFPAGPLWVMRTESWEPALAAASSRLNMAALSRAAATAAMSEEPDLVVTSAVRGSDTVSAEPDLDTTTVGPARQRPL